MRFLSLQEGWCTVPFCRLCILGVLLALAAWKSVLYFKWSGIFSYQCLIPEVNAWFQRSMIDPRGQCLIPEVNAWFQGSMLDPRGQCLIPEVNAWSQRSMLDPSDQCLILRLVHLSWYPRYYKYRATDYSTVDIRTIYIRQKRDITLNELAPSREIIVHRSI